MKKIFSCKSPVEWPRYILQESILSCTFEYLREWSKGILCWDFSHFRGPYRDACTKVGRRTEHRQYMRTSWASIADSWNSQFPLCLHGFRENSPYTITPKRFPLVIRKRTANFSDLTITSSIALECIPGAFDYLNSTPAFAYPIRIGSGYRVQLSIWKLPSVVSHHFSMLGSTYK